MRLSYSDIFNQFLIATNSSQSAADATLITFFNASLNQRYQLILSELADYKTTKEYSFSTTANTQYYSYPQDFVKPESMYVTIGSVNFPLQPILDRFSWNKLNAIPVQAGAIPQYYFSRPRDFGIWPIPQQVYTGSMSYWYRDRDLLYADFAGGTAGTFTYTNNSKTVTDNIALLQTSMNGLWINIVAPSDGSGLQEQWYRIASVTNTTTLLLETPFISQNGATTITNDSRICQTPEIPEEGHQLLIWGVISDFYAGPRKDPKNAATYNNMFWTGNPDNANRTESEQHYGGLLGLKSRYSDRDDRRVIKRKPKMNPLNYKVWATTLS